MTGRESFDVWLKRVSGFFYDTPSGVKYLGKAVQDNRDFPKNGTFEEYLAYFQRDNYGRLSPVGELREAWKLYEADLGDPANPKMKEHYGCLWVVAAMGAVVLYVFLTADPARQDPKNWTKEDWQREETQAWDEHRWPR